MNISTILVSDGGVAGDIREELPGAPFSKVQIGAPIGSYGDYIFRQVPDADAVRLKLTYPDAVRII
jgi:hypothetical protein